MEEVCIRRLPRALCPFLLPNLHLPSWNYPNVTLIETVDMDMPSYPGYYVIRERATPAAF